MELLFTGNSGRLPMPTIPPMVQRLNAPLYPRSLGPYVSPRLGVGFRLIIKLDEDS